MERRELSHVVKECRDSGRSILRHTNMDWCLLTKEYYCPYQEPGLKYTPKTSPAEPEAAALHHCTKYKQDS